MTDIDHKHEHNNDEDIIDVENLTIKYGKKVVLKNVSFTLPKETFLTIIGKNGSGKSSLIKAIMNLVKYKGNISIDGNSTAKINKKEMAKKVAYVPQFISSSEDVTVYDYISFGRFPYTTAGFLSKKDKKIIESIMKKLQILDLKDDFISNLSGGQKQKVSIAAAIVQDTELIILDEPTNNLDIYNQYELLEILHYLHEQGKTIVLIAHDINHAIKYSDKVLILNDKKIYSYGSPHKLITEKSIKDVLNVKPVFSEIRGVNHIIDIDTRNIQKEVKNDS